MMCRRKSDWSVRWMLCAEWQSLHTGRGFVDAAVALAAGIGDVVAVHAGARVACGQFQVRAVALRAVGRHGQPGFEQTPPVNALGVVLHNVVLFPGVGQRRLLARAVALGAETGHVARESRRIQFGLAQDAVGSVTIAASGSVGVALGGQLPVRALPVVGHLVGVAVGAIHLGADGFARALLGRRASGVALHAGRFDMARLRQLVLLTKRETVLPPRTVFSSGLAWHR